MHLFAKNIFSLLRLLLFISFALQLAVQRSSGSSQSEDQSVDEVHQAEDTAAITRTSPLRTDAIHEFRISVTPADSSVKLPHEFIIARSESLWHGERELANGQEYVVDARHGIVIFLEKFRSQLREDTSSQHVIRARYRVLPFKFKEHYQHRELVVKEDTAAGEAVRVARPTVPFSVDDLFGANLYKSGSIVRGFSVGSNRDLSLSSGFRMQMAGKLASDVEVVAAFTDENTPIQPEGNTQTLQEIDKVFVEIRSTDLSATLGDFNVDFGGNEFGLYQRKLQGAKGMANYRTSFSTGSLIVSGAVARGKFTTNQFLGLEGVQGPYRLFGQNNQRDIIIIAGTERVYVDGELMTRGETNDYAIDYAGAELTFTSRRLITRDSRIVVDFEYTDRRFTRNMLAAKTGASFADSKIHFNATLIREADDQNAPIDISLTETDKEILRQAGGDRLWASRTGVDSVGAGKGQYVAVDTLIGGQAVRFYKFAPTDSNAHFSVTFTFVGHGQGDYVRVSLGNYRYAGQGNGDYLPIRFLPLPQLQTLADFDLAAQVTDYLSLSGEYALSTVDLNRFSSLDDADKKGSALRLSLQLNPRNVRIGETNIGSFDLRLRERFIDRRFTPIDRTNEIEFNRKWSIERVEKVDEEVREGTLRYQPFAFFSLGGGLGRITRGEQFHSNRSEISALVGGEGLPFGLSASADGSAEPLRTKPKVSYDLEVIRSKDRILDDRSNWTRQKGIAEYTLGSITPSFRFEREVRRVNSLGVDTLKSASFRYNEFAPRFSIADVWGMTLSSEVEWRTDDIFLNGTLQRESETFTQQYGWRLREWKTLTSSIDVTLRKKRFTQPLRLKGNGDVETVLLRSQNRYSPLKRGIEADVFYEAATQRSSKLERVYVQVPKGSGNFRYLGDVNNNGFMDDADFQLDRFEGDFVVFTVPSDELFPIVDLKASTRLRITPARFLGRSNWLEEVVSALSAETYLRVEEKSREPNTRKIYLLNLSRFLNDSMTITGNNFYSQDLHIFESRPDFSTRLRYSQRNGFTQFALANERSYSRERSLRVRWRLVPEISNQVDYINKNDRVRATEGSGRSRDITSNSVLSDWSYRPVQPIELGFAVGVGRAIDRDSLPNVTADFNTQSVRFVYSFQERGQGRVELQREEVLVDGRKAVLPFELTGGRVPGKTWLWRLTFDYGLTQFIQTHVSYDGRTEGGRSPIHTARAEVRAFF